MYGWRGRIGIIISPVNTVCENELNRMAPEGVSVHATRQHGPKDPVKLTAQTLAESNKDLAVAAGLLADFKPGTVALANTLGSLIYGRPQYDAHIVRTMETASGCPGMTSATALLEAVEALKVHSLVIVAPYDSGRMQMEQDYLSEAKPGLRVVGRHSLGLETGWAFGRLPPWAAYEAARDADHSDADAVFLSGTNWRTIEVIEALEADLRKPVLTANQVIMWAALRRLKVSGGNGYGILFKTH